MSENAVRHPIFARLYERMSGMAEKAGVAQHREQLLEGIGGRVVEIGAGNGHNFGHYPDTVTEVVAVEPEAYLRSRAEQAARRAKLPITVVEGTAEALPVESESFDAAVFSLVLCSVGDQDPEEEGPDGRPAKYPPALRREALALVKSSRCPVAEVVRSLDLAEGTLWNWVKAEREAAERRPRRR